MNKLPSNIFLIGFMGSGKTSMAKEIAKKINYVFIDSDIAFAEIMNETVSNFINNHGEAEFRHYEHEVLKKIIQGKNQVIATGGGTPCFYNNMQLINENGISIYLKIPVEILVERLINSKTERPLLKNVSTADLPYFVKSLIKQREQYYFQSHHFIESDSLSPNDIIGLLF